MARLALARRIDIAAQLAVRARTYFDVFEFFEDVETGPRINDAINDYPWFFRLHHHVYRFAFIVEIAGLFKRTTGTVNLPHLLKECRSSLKETEWQAVSTKLDEWRPIAEKAELIRSKALAHRSADLDYDDAFKEANVTRNQLRGLSDLSLDVANRLCEATGRSTQIFVTRETVRDAKRLFKALGSTFDESEPKSALDELFGE
ncbi:MAG: hypothetical protein AB7O98_08575 [Hyphomonadaceae bacterium]